MKAVGILGLILNIIGILFAFLGTSFQATGWALPGMTDIGTIGFGVILIGVGSICLSLGRKD